MAKTTVLLLFFLSIFLTLLFGVNVGKRLEKRNLALSNLPTPSESELRTSNLELRTTPTTTPQAVSTPEVGGLSNYSDQRCGFSFSFPGSYLSSKTENGQAMVFTEKDNPKNFIVATCSTELPKPPLTSDKTESLTLDGVTATLYHDQNPDGSPRDEVIVKHPTNGLEIIIAGFGETFQQVFSSFRFIR